MSFVDNGPAMLFCPGNRPDRFGKARERSDTVILDLEDAVGPEEKDAAREMVAGALADLGSAAMVRVNAVGSPWHDDDLRMARASGAATVMVPKVQHRSDLDHLDGVSVLVICETARGVLRAEQILEHPNCVGVLWGGEDLTADLGGTTSRSQLGTYHGVVGLARHMTLLAAAAAGKIAVDAVHVDIPDLTGLRRESLEAVEMGFQAKACIHPSHVPVIRQSFTPSAEDVTWARGVLKAAASAGSAVFSYGGRMIDEPLLRHARRIETASTNK